MAFAGKEVDLFLKELIVEIVIFYLLEEAYKGLLESTPSLTDVNQRLIDQHHLILRDSLPTVIPKLILRSYFLDLLREVFPLRRVLVP